MRMEEQEIDHYEPEDRNSSSKREDDFYVGSPSLARPADLTDTRAQRPSASRRTVRRSRSRSRSPPPRRRRSRSRSRSRDRYDRDHRDRSRSPSRRDRDRSRSRERYRRDRDEEKPSETEGAAGPKWGNAPNAGAGRGGFAGRGRGGFGGDPFQRQMSREVAAQEASKRSVKENRVYVGNLPFSVKWSDLKVRSLMAIPSFAGADLA